MSLAYRVLFAGSFDFYPSLFEKLCISNSVLCVSRCQFGGWQLVVGGWQFSSWATSMIQGMFSLLKFPQH